MIKYLNEHLERLVEAVAEYETLCKMEDDGDPGFREKDRENAYDGIAELAMDIARLASKRRRI